MPAGCRKGAYVKSDACYFIIRLIHDSWFKICSLGDEPRGGLVQKLHINYSHSASEE